jgi:hypothetical protein
MKDFSKLFTISMNGDGGGFVNTKKNETSRHLAGMVAHGDDHDQIENYYSVTDSRAGCRIGRSLVEAYRVLSFERELKGGGYWYDDFDGWYRMASGLYDQYVHEVENMNLDTSEHGDLTNSESFRSFEINTARKIMTCYRRKGLGSVSRLTSNLVTMNLKQTEALLPYIRELGTHLVTKIDGKSDSEIMSLKRWLLPINKSKGMPTVASGGDKLAGLLSIGQMLSSEDFDEYYERASESTEQMLPTAGISLVRYQSAGKEIEQYDVIDGRLKLSGVKTPYAPKVRRVIMNPIAHNCLYTPVAAVIRGYLALDPRYCANPVSFGWLKAYGSLYASDLSKYDTTVSAETIVAVHEYILDPIMSLLAKRNLISERFERLYLGMRLDRANSVVIVPPSSHDSLFEIIPNVGTIPSGVKTTSVEGTLIRAALFAYKCNELNITCDYLPDEHYNPFEEHSNPKLTCLILGDDLLVAAGKHRESEADLELFKRDNAIVPGLGFDESHSDDTNFLMRREPEGFLYASRALNSIINKEIQNEPSTTSVAILGLLSRDAGIRNAGRGSSSMPNPTRDVYRRCISSLIMKQRSRKSQADVTMLLLASTRLTLEKSGSYFSSLYAQYMGGSFNADDARRKNAIALLDAINSAYGYMPDSVDDAMEYLSTIHGFESELVDKARDIMDVGRLTSVYNTIGSSDVRSWSKLSDDIDIRRVLNRHERRKFNQVLKDQSTIDVFHLANGTSYGLSDLLVKTRTKIDGVMRHLYGRYD